MHVKRDREIEKYYWQSRESKKFIENQQVTELGAIVQCRSPWCLLRFLRPIGGGGNMSHRACKADDDDDDVFWGHILFPGNTHWWRTKFKTMHPLPLLWHASSSSSILGISHGKEDDTLIMFLKVTWCKCSFQRIRVEEDACHMRWGRCMVFLAVYILNHVQYGNMM